MRDAGAVPGAVARTAWIAPAAMLLGAGWGSNQFTPLLLVYRRLDGLGTETLAALFGVYALGLLPGLLFGGAISDARGRRPVVVVATVASLAGSLALTAATGTAMLLLGRLLIGAGAGAALSAGSAWVRELSAGSGGDTQRAARRTAVAITTGFALGPLVAGLLAEWVVAPRIVPYMPHVVLMAGVLVAVCRTPETVASHAAPVPWPSLVGLRDERFRAVVAPAAPWVFTAPAIAFALLPSVVGAERVAHGVALTAVVTSLCALAGVLVQPLARRVAGDGGARVTVAGLLVLVGGLVLAAVTARAGEVWLLVPCALVLGAAYGLCLVGGLAEVQGLADPRSLASMTASYYLLTYLGFAAPFALSLAAHVVSYTTLLAGAALLALATAGLVAVRISSGAGRAAGAAATPR